MSKRIFSFVFWGLALVAPGPLLTVNSNNSIFHDGTASAGITFRHFNGMSGRFHMIENLGSGCALFDFDNDGDLDLYLVQGGSLDGTRPAGGPSMLTDRLYRNTLSRAGASESLHFEDVTCGAGLGFGGYGMGVASGDFDNDGRIDLYVTAWGRNRLLRDLGRGRFSDVADRSGVQDTGWSVPALFFDYDRDGWLDPVVVNGAVRRLKDLVQKRDPHPFHQPNQLFRNLGGGRFSETSGLAGEAFLASQVSRGAAFGDIDNDGDTDLVVSNNNGAVSLLLNQVGRRNHWLGLRLVADRRDALGAVATISSQRWASFGSANPHRRRLRLRQRSKGSGRAGPGRFGWRSEGRLA